MASVSDPTGTSLIGFEQGVSLKTAEQIIQQTRARFHPMANPDMVFVNKNQMFASTLLRIKTVPDDPGDGKCTLKVLSHNGQVFKIRTVGSVPATATLAPLLPADARWLSTSTSFTLKDTTSKSIKFIADPTVEFASRGLISGEYKFGTKNLSNSITTLISRMHEAIMLASDSEEIAIISAIGLSSLGLTQSNSGKSGNTTIVKSHSGADDLFTISGTGFSGGYLGMPKEQNGTVKHSADSTAFALGLVNSDPNATSVSLINQITFDINKIINANSRVYGIRSRIINNDILLITQDIKGTAGLTVSGTSNSVELTQTGLSDEKSSSSFSLSNSRMVASEIDEFTFVDIDSVKERLIKSHQRKLVMDTRSWLSFGHSLGESGEIVAPFKVFDIARPDPAEETLFELHFADVLTKEQIATLDKGETPRKWDVVEGKLIPRTDFTKIRVDLSNIGFPIPDKNDYEQYSLVYDQDAGYYKLRISALWDYLHNDGDDFIRAENTFYARLRNGLKALSDSFSQISIEITSREDPRFPTFNSPVPQALWYELDITEERRLSYFFFEWGSQISTHANHNQEDHPATKKYFLSDLSYEKPDGDPDVIVSFRSSESSLYLKPNHDLQIRSYGMGRATNDLKFFEDLSLSGDPGITPVGTTISKQTAELSSSYGKSIMMDPVFYLKAENDINFPVQINNLGNILGFEYDGTIEPFEIRNAMLGRNLAESSFYGIKGALVGTYNYNPRLKFSELIHNKISYKKFPVVPYFDNAQTILDMMGLNFEIVYRDAALGQQRMSAEEALAARHESFGSGDRHVYAVHQEDVALALYHPVNEIIFSNNDKIFPFIDIEGSVFQAMPLNGNNPENNEFDSLVLELFNMGRNHENHQDDLNLGAENFRHRAGFDYASNPHPGTDSIVFGGLRYV